MKASGRSSIDPVLAVELRGGPRRPLVVGLQQLLHQHREETSEDGRSGDLEDTFGSSVAHPPVDPLPGPSVQPGGGGPDGLPVLVDEPGAVSLPGQPDGHDGVVGFEGIGDLADAVGHRLPDEIHILLGLAVAAVLNGYGLVVAGDDRS